jgi:hypothetical protein
MLLAQFFVFLRNQWGTFSSQLNYFFCGMSDIDEPNRLLPKTDGSLVADKHKCEKGRFSLTSGKLRYLTLSNARELMIT